MSKTEKTQKKNVDNEKEKKDDDSNDYQLSRAFDLILALNLVNKKTVQ